MHARSGNKRRRVADRGNLAKMSSTIDVEFILMKPKCPGCKAVDSFVSFHAEEANFDYCEVCGIVVYHRKNE